MAQRRPQFYNTDDIPGSRPGTQQCVGKSGRHTDPLNPSYSIASAKQSPAPPPKFIRDAMDVSDITGARPATVGSGLRVFRGGSMIVDWTRAHQEGKKDSSATRPPTGASSNADIEGAQPNKNAIYRAGSKCDWTRARAADANERGQSSLGRENVGGNDGQLGPSRIASAIQHYVIDPTVSPAGSPSRKNLLVARPTTSGGVSSGENKGSKSVVAKKPPHEDTGSGQQPPAPKANKVVGDGTFDVFGRPMGVKASRSNSTPMPQARVGEEGGGSAVGSGVKKGNGGKRGAKDWSVKNVCDWLSSMEMGERGEEYVEAFRRIGIDGSILGDLDDSTLESEVGIKLSLHRKKILTKVKALLANQ